MKIILFAVVLLSAALPLHVVCAGSLQHRYSFELDARDTIGTAHGQLVGGATISGGAAVLNGTTAYVNLPNNLLTGYTAVTLEAWVTDNGSSTWARIFDFGNSSSGEDFPLSWGGSALQSVWLTVRSSSGTLLGAYVTPSLSQGLEWPGTTIPTGVRKHVVWASDAAAQTAWLYVDGQLVASSTAFSLSPAALGPTVNNWLGRSQYQDPLFRGSYSEFRIYNEALDTLQIAVNLAAGPDRVVTDPGPLRRVTLQVAGALPLGSTQTATVLGEFANVTNVDLTLVPGLILRSSDPAVVAVAATGQVTATGSGVAWVTATFQGVSDTEFVQVTAPPQTLAHRYSFTTDASDSEGAAHGSLAAGATISSGAVRLNGSTAYVDLPNNLVTGLTSVSFEAWFTDNGGGGWARLWDFGNSAGGEGYQGGGTSYLFLSVPAGFGGVRAAYKLPSSGEQVVDFAARPSLGVKHHVVWTQDGNAQCGRLYLDGSLVASNNAFSFTPAAVGNTVNDWLGRSQYNDPYFLGSIDEFRLYTAALSPDEVALDYQLGPDVSPQSVPVTILSQPQNTTVAESHPALFSVRYAGRRPVQFQWFRDQAAIPGATNATYLLPAPIPTDSGARFSVALTNVANNSVWSAISSNAVLTVVPDTNRPTVARIFNVGSTNVRIVFSEPVRASSAQEPANYSFTNALPVLAATPGEDGRTVTLTTSPLVLGTTYTLLLSGIQDCAFTPNTILSNTPVSFTAQPFAVEDIGDATPASAWAGAADQGRFSAGGVDISGTQDQCGFAYQVLTGDFDWQVRVPSLAGADPFAKAGLMVRESLDPGSRFAAALATAGSQGSFFAYRPGYYAEAARSGAFPLNFPNTWLRLQRAGNRFSGFASYDGQTWAALGSVTLELGPTLYVGLALASHVEGQAATGQFEGLGPAVSTAVDAVVRPGEPLGPSSRRTPIVISEILYKPAKRSDGRNTEYVELYNSNPWSQDVSGYRLDGQIQFTFPAQTSIPGNGFLVVAAVPEDLQAAYGLAGVLGPYTNSLKTSGALKLLDEAGALLLELNYSDTAPWPMGADGSGHSIVLARPSYGEGDPRAWERSEIVGGSPGAPESYRPSVLRNVVINEILAHTDLPDVDSVELYNHSNQAIDLSGCILSDEPTQNKFLIPTNTIIPPRGFISFTETQLGFGLNAAGETVYFKDPAGARVLDALRFGAQQNGVAFGRYPDGASAWYRLSAKTLGSSNAPPLVSEVGLNEIMYHPLSGLDDDQYVELFNHGTNTVDLAGWKFVAGISYTFPAGTVLAPAGYLVIAANASRLLTNYPQLNRTNTVGNFSGHLSHAGERLALAKPDVIVGLDSAGRRVTNQVEIVVDEVTYGTGGRWGRWADGGGSSLELVDARADKRLAANWADSDETSKAPWTTVECTGTLDLGANYEPAITYAQIGLLDAGECLVDDIEVRPGTNGANYVANGSFTSGLSNWSLVGDHCRSSLETNAGYPAGANALHLRTANRLWTGANAAQVSLSSTNLAPGQIATLRFKGRWLCGWPEVLLRLSGNWLDAFGRLQVPANLGSPGLPNSRAVANAGPAIAEVSHSPALPTAGQPVVVTARAADPDGVASLKVQYRLDPAAATYELPMRDDGTGGDAVAGDGVYSATLPGQPAGQIIAFVLVATDTRGATSRFPANRNDNAPVRECVVAFGDPNPASAFGAYHFWLTKTNVDRWVALPILSNEEMDATLVYGNRIVYNVSGRYGGSPYHQSFDSPTGSRACHYIWSIPKDDLFLGASSLNKIHWPGNDIQDDSSGQNVNDATLQREQAANTFLRALGVPWMNRRFVAVYVNGGRRGALMEDALRPNISIQDEYFPNDTGGQVFKFQPWFEFGATPSGNYVPWANQSWGLFMPYTTTGGAYKPARYRWSYEFRDTPTSCNDFTNLFTLITAGSAWAQPGYVNALSTVADMENWMRVVAANHAAGNWDCWGVNNEQNVFAYVSPQRRWTLFMSDFNIVLGNRISWGPGENLLSVNGDDSNWQHIYSTPAFRRMYWRALKELANSAMLPANLNPLLEAKYAAFCADGLKVQDPAAIESWVAQARASILNQIEDASAFTLAATSFTASGNAITLSGNAPVEVTTVLVNGQAWTPVWTSVTGWSLRIPVPAGANTWTVAAYDRDGRPVGSTRSITINNPAVPESPVGNIVFNEILWSPALPGAEFVELYNRSSTTTFDLSGWRVNGLSYTFPPGSAFAPQTYLVLARSPMNFAAAFGALTPVFDTFDGTLQPDGETLTLIRPGASSGPDTIVDQVRYEPTAPWPAAAAKSGTALQLIDASQDNSRVANWTTDSPTATNAPRWVFASTNIVATSSRLYLYLLSAGDLYLDDLKLVSGALPEAGTNWLRNGDFEAPLSSAWTATANFAQSTVSSLYRHSGASSLHLVATAAGSGSNNALYQDILPALTNGATYTLSFWYLPSTNGGPLCLRLSYATVNPTFNPAPVTPIPAAATPGAPNSVRATLPPFPPLWLNEAQPENLTGGVDNFGERDPWIELYNPTTNTVSLAGLYLGTNYSAPNLWAFPSNALIAPGQFLVVWADGQPQQSAGAWLHTSFRLNPSSGTVACSRPDGTTFQLIDYLNYSSLPANYSYGSVPDGQPFYRQPMFRASPGATNNAALPPLTVVINEWMAENSGFLNDPATSKFDDWFELYNPADLPAELGGYYLTDALDNPLQFQIPSGYRVPPKGFLLVWADGKPSANSTNSPDLHVSFKLDKAGEAIGLFSAVGEAIDAVTFAAQTANVSEGRFPDGGNLRLFMPAPSPRAANILPPAPNPPAFSGLIQLTDKQQVALEFQAAAGHTYRIEFKDDLSSPMWFPLGPDQMATASTLTALDPAAIGVQRFYRIVQVR